MWKAFQCLKQIEVYLTNFEHFFSIELRNAYKQVLWANPLQIQLIEVELRFLQSLKYEA